MQHARRRRRTVLLLVVAAIGAGAGAVLYGTDALRAFELESVDARFALRGDDTRPAGVVVLGMDPDTSVRLGRQPPFPRRWHARAIRALRRAGARTIAYDIEFATPTTLRDDNALFEAVRRAGNVVLGTNKFLDGGETAVLGGNANVRAARATVGFAAFDADKGDVIRRVRAELERTPTFAAVAAGRVPAPAREGSGVWIDFRGDVDVVPFWRALEGGLPPAAIRDKVVVVGDTDPTGQDVHATPVGTRSGPEINAAAIDTLQRDAPVRDVPGGVGYLVVALLGVAVPLAALRLRSLRWLPIAGALALLWPVAAQLWFQAGRVAPLVPGEAALLAGSLGTLVLAYWTELRGRRRLREQFGRFVPASVVDAVVEEADDQAHLPGVRREGTVLFADLRGFTAVAESLEAEAVIDLLNLYLTVMSDAILDAGGTVVSYMGDGIMAVFGAPLEQADHADRALEAARSMVGSCLDAFNRRHGLDQRFAIGVGLASGPVMSGTVGSARRVEYSAVGDTTNTAARLEAMTKETGHCLHVAGSTRAALTRDAPDLEEIGGLRLRGKSGVARVWTVTPVTLPATRP